MAPYGVAVLFAKDLKTVAEFYVQAMGMVCTLSDEHHWTLSGCGFALTIYQIPEQMAGGITIHTPPERRVWGAIRLDFPVQSIAGSREVARSIGGEIDDVPPDWAGRNANFFLGYDPEGNVFGVSQHAD